MAIKMERPPIVSLFAIALILGVFLATGFQGVHAKIEGDESWIYLHTIKTAADGKSLLPHNYFYPSEYFYAGLAMLTPEAIKYKLTPNKIGFGNYLRSHLDDQSLLERMRRFIVLLSSFTILWVFLIVWVLKKDPWIALFAAALVAFSPDFVALTRRFRSDPMLTHFGMLSLLLICCGLRSRNLFNWLNGAAASAGLAAGAKYPGAIFIVPVFVIIFQRSIFRKENFSRSIKPYALAISFFTLAYIATTPGMLLEFPQFIADLRIVQSVYAHGWHYKMERATPGLPHLLMIIELIFGRFLSAWPSIALGLSLPAIAGIYRLLQEDRHMALATIVAVIIYLAFFSMQVYMIPRNYHVIIPLIAMASAYGFGTLLERMIPYPKWRIGLQAALIFVLAANCAWIYISGNEISSILWARRLTES